MNANIRNSEIKHCPYPKCVMIKRPNLYNLQTKKTSENDQELKFIKKTFNINTGQKSKMVRSEMYTLQTRHVQFKDQKKDKNVINSKKQTFLKLKLSKDLKYK